MQRGTNIRTTTSNPTLYQYSTGHVEYVTIKPEKVGPATVLHVIISKRYRMEEGNKYPTSRIMLYTVKHFPR